MSEKKVEYSINQLNCICAPGTLIIEVKDVKPKETRGKSRIIAPVQNTKAFNVQDIEEIFSEHPYQGVVKVFNPYDKKDEWINVGDTVLLNRELGPRDAVLINGKVYGHIKFHDLVCKIL
jgi:hypothetical protein